MAKKPAIIIDNGSYMTKVGFAADEAPKTEFLTKVGYLRHLPGESELARFELKQCYVGDDVNPKRGIITVKYPVEHGVIDKWEEIEKIWQHTFEKLEVTSEEHSVLLTEAANNPKASREKMAEVLMEKFNVPALFVGIQGVLSMYATGRQTGTSLSIGAGVTQIIPVDKGYAIPNASTCLNLGGQIMNLYLAKILTESGFRCNYKYFIDEARNIKEKFCYVASDFDKDMESAPKKARVEEETYELPDGEIITPRNEKFRCPEILFKPSLLGGLDDIVYEDGIQKECYNSITKCDLEVQPLLYKNIILSGGTTMLPGLADRLENEIKSLAPADTALKIVASPHRKNNVWIGGSILAGLGTFQEMWITKQQYSEHGSSVVHKCPSA